MHIYLRHKKGDRQSSNEAKTTVSSQQSFSHLGIEQANQPSALGLTKMVLLLTLALLAVKPASAQWSDIRDRTYSLVGLGGNVYFNDNNKPFEYLGYQGDIGFGLNLTSVVGARIQAMFLHNANTVEIKSNYLSVHIDATFDLLNLIAGNDANRRHNLKLLLGMGYVQRQPNYLEVVDNEVTIVPGISYTYPIVPSIYFLAELKSYLFLPRFDFNELSSGLVFATVGIQHRFCDNPYRNGLCSGGDKMHENWYASAEWGLNSLRYAGLAGGDVMRLMKPAFGITVGKYLSPVLNMRVGILGISAGTDATTNFNIASARADLLLNLNNMAYPRQNRKWTTSLLVGAGMINRMDSHTMTFGVNFGAQERYWLSNRSDLVAEVRYFMTTQGFAHDMPGQSQTSVGLLSFVLGYIYNITYGTMR